MAENDENTSATNAAPERIEKEVVERGIQGTVKWFNVKSGYGFIQRFDTKTDLFIHQSEISVNNPAKSRRSVGENEEIEFDVAKGAKGLEAVNVTGPRGAPVQGSRYARNFRSRRGGRYRNFSQSSDRGGGRGPPRGGGGGRMMPEYHRRPYNRPYMNFRQDYYDGPPEYMGGPYPPPGRMMYYGPPPPRRPYFRPPGPGGYYFRRPPPGDDGGPPMRPMGGGYRGRFRGPRRPDYSPRERGDSANMNDGPPEQEGGRRFRGGYRRKRRSMNKSDTEGTDHDAGADGVAGDMEKMSLKEQGAPVNAVPTNA